MLCLPGHTIVHVRFGTRTASYLSAWGPKTIPSTSLMAIPSQALTQQIRTLVGFGALQLYAPLGLLLLKEHFSLPESLLAPRPVNTGSLLDHQVNNRGFSKLQLLDLAAP
jgi:hypothetical protein